FKVVDSVENGDISVNGKSGKLLSEITRDNADYKKKASGKFESDINGLINGKIKLNVSVREEKKIKNAKTFSSSDSFVNLCDFAQAIHRSFQTVYGGPDFNGLSLEFRLSNIEQAKSYADKLELINCFYSEKELDYPIVTGFVNRKEAAGESVRDDLNFLAREEHLRWVREKLASGWTYGTDYKNSKERNEKKIHKDIVPFDLLPEDERRKDELMIQNMVPLLYHYGHGVRIYSCRGLSKPVLNIAGCGHRSVTKSTDKLKEQIKSVLRKYQNDYTVVVRTCFASGADQLIAESAMELGIAVKAVLPLPYEEYIRSVRDDARKSGYPFGEKEELRMRHLLAQTVTCKVVEDKTYTYLEASKHILNKCTKLIALWDGIETPLTDAAGNPINRGGTWHTICLAKEARSMT
ncbi:MAG: hypothetical protein K2M48_04570, partial [Clostridiales bacterium]|nr:hypothetical protein [Clostridiales bacterium]